MVVNSFDYINCYHFSLGGGFSFLILYRYFFNFRCPPFRGNICYGDGFWHQFKQEILIVLVLSVHNLVGIKGHISVSNYAFATK